jgi:hypothetical protein
MNSPATDTASALARLDAWLASMGAPVPGGPVVGLRGVSMAFAGPGFDWRIEALLDAWTALHVRTGDARFLDRIEAAMGALAASQLPNGAFRNSYFEFNPFEGGMPHEPAAVAAALRARTALLAAGRAPPAGFDDAVDRFAERRLVSELWNRSLRTFNDWLQSEFETFAPASVAAAIEALLAWSDASGRPDAGAAHVEGAGESLLAVQRRGGALDGAFPASNRRGDSANPYLSARVLPALAALRSRAGDARYGEAAERLEGFLRRTERPGGGWPFLVHAARPPTDGPVLVGAAAGVEACRARAGLAPACSPRTMAFVLAHQQESGAFPTADGFPGGRRGQPEWRDVVPVAAWNAMILHRLALDAPAALPGAPAPGAVRRDIRVNGRPAAWTETAEGFGISNSERRTPDAEHRTTAADRGPRDGGGKPGVGSREVETDRSVWNPERGTRNAEPPDAAARLYSWRRGAAWAEVCRL